MVEWVHQSTVTSGDLMQQGTISQTTSILVVFANWHNRVERLIILCIYLALAVIMTEIL